MSEDRRLRNVIEAALLAAGRPIGLPELCQLFEETLRPEPEAVRAALEALAAEYSDRGIELAESAGGFRIQVRRELASEVSRLWPERPPRYSRALLETLALIAYRQPITRAEIEAVRGVAVNPNTLKTLMERSWVRVVGHRDVPGRPELLGTTRDFLDHFGLRSLDQLPPLADLKAMGEAGLDGQLELPAGAAAVAFVPPAPGSEEDDGGRESGAAAEDAAGAAGETEGGALDDAPDGGPTEECGDDGVARELVASGPPVD